MRHAEICFKVKIELFRRDGEFTIFEVIWNRGISEGWDNPCRRIIRDSPWLRSKKKRGRRSSPLSRRSLRPSANFSWYIVPSSLFSSAVLLSSQYPVNARLYASDGGAIPSVAY